MASNSLLQLRLDTESELHSRLHGSGKPSSSSADVQSALFAPTDAESLGGDTSLLTTTMTEPVLSRGGARGNRSPSKTSSSVPEGPFLSWTEPTELQDIRRQHPRAHRKRSKNNDIIVRSQLQDWLLARGRFVQAHKLPDNMKGMMSQWFQTMERRNGSVAARELQNELKKLTAYGPSDIADVISIVSDPRRHRGVSWEDLERFLINKGRTSSGGSVALPSGTALPVHDLVAAMRRTLILADVMAGGHRRRHWQGVAEDEDKLRRELTDAFQDLIKAYQQKPGQGTGPGSGSATGFGGGTMGASGASSSGYGQGGKKPAKGRGQGHGGPGAQGRQGAATSHKLLALLLEGEEGPGVQEGQAPRRTPTETMQRFLPLLASSRASAFNLSQQRPEGMLLHDPSHGHGHGLGVASGQGYPSQAELGPPTVATQTPAGPSRQDPTATDQPPSEATSPLATFTQAPAPAPVHGAGPGHGASSGHGGGVVAGGWAGAEAAAAAAAAAQAEAERRRILAALQEELEVQQQRLELKLSAAAEQREWVKTTSMRVASHEQEAESRPTQELESHKEGVPPRERPADKPVEKLPERAMDKDRSPENERGRDREMKEAGITPRPSIDPTPVSKPQQGRGSQDGVGHKREKKDDHQCRGSQDGRRSVDESTMSATQATDQRLSGSGAVACSPELPPAPAPAPALAPAPAAQNLTPPGSSGSSAGAIDTVSILASMPMNGRRRGAAGSQDKGWVPTGSARDPDAAKQTRAAPSKAPVKPQAPAEGGSSTKLPSIQKGSSHSPMAPKREARSTHRTLPAVPQPQAQLPAPALPTAPVSVSLFDFSTGNASPIKAAAGSRAGPGAGCGHGNSLPALRGRA